MAGITQETVFTAEALRHGIEDRDVEALVGLYAADAELRIVDAQHSPSEPRVLRGSGEFRPYFEDVCGREMTHALERIVIGETGAAFTEACAYPDGTRVLCTAVIDLTDGRITRQTCVQAWDS